MACELPLLQGAAAVEEVEEEEGADRGEMATTPLRSQSKHGPCLKATPT